MEEVELPEGFSQYLMLYDGKESVVASYKMIEGYEVMGWMVAKGTLPCSDGCYRIDRYDSQHTVFSMNGLTVSWSFWTTIRVKSFQSLWMSFWRTMRK